MLKINYHSEVQLKEVYRGGFESEVESMINDIANFLKKEDRAIMGESLTLTPEGEVEVLVQNTSRVCVKADYPVSVNAVYCSCAHVHVFVAPCRTG